MKNLYIIGNGFDCHHGLCSSYRAYREWLKKNHSELYIQMKDFYDVQKDEWWWQFETNLGKINLRDYISLTALVYQPDFSKEEFKEQDREAGAIQAESEIGDFVTKIKATFKKWIESLPEADKNKKIELSGKDSFFINFNYTPTLQKLYNIPEAQVLHIHGNISDKEIVLGHNTTYEELQNATEEELPEPPPELTGEALGEWYTGQYDDTKERVRNAAVNEIYELRKDIEEIIKTNRSVFSQMSEIQNIYAFGFSFSPVDQPYLDEIIRHINARTTRWTISYLTDIDNRRITDYMQSQGILSHLWQPLVQLEDLLVANRQLKLF